MCLITRFEKPFVAKTDIKVCKLIERRNINPDGSYVYLTPFRKMEVKLGKEIKPDTDDNATSWAKDSNGITNEWKYGSGWIHSVIQPQLYFSIHDCVLSVIPKGTEYVIDSFGETLCSRRLILGEKVLPKEKLSKEEISSYSTILWYDLVSNIPKDKVSEGWIVIDFLGKERLVHPSKVDYINNMLMIKGIVYEVDEKTGVCKACSFNALERISLDEIPASVINRCNFCLMRDYDDFSSMCEELIKTDDNFRNNFDESWKVNSRLKTALYETNVWFPIIYSLMDMTQDYRSLKFYIPNSSETFIERMKIQTRHHLLNNFYLEKEFKL